MTYKPYHTPLLLQAQSHGCRKLVHGVEMLIAQGLAAQRLWGVLMSAEERRRVHDTVLAVYRGYVHDLPADAQGNALPFPDTLEEAAKLLPNLDLLRHVSLQ